MTLSVDDRLEIQDLLSRYAHAFDATDGEAWAKLFTADGLFVVRDNPDPAAAPTKVRGRPELAAFVHDRQQKYGGTIRHWVNEILLTPTPEGASGKVYIMLLKIGAVPQVVLTGHYLDEYVKSAEGWQFQSRTFFRDF